MTNWRLIKTAPKGERVLVRNRFLDAVQIACRIDDEDWLPDGAGPYEEFVTNAFGKLVRNTVSGAYDYWAHLPEFNFITRYDAEQAERQAERTSVLSRAFVDDLTLGY